MYRLTPTCGLFCYDKGAVCCLLILLDKNPSMVFCAILLGTNTALITVECMEFWLTFSPWHSILKFLLSKLQVSSCQVKWTKPNCCSKRKKKLKTSDSCSLYWNIKIDCEVRSCQIWLLFSPVSILAPALLLISQWYNDIGLANTLLLNSDLSGGCVVICFKLWFKW